MAEEERLAVPQLRTAEDMSIPEKPLVKATGRIRALEEQLADLEERLGIVLNAADQEVADLYEVCAYFGFVIGNLMDAVTLLAEGIEAGPVLSILERMPLDATAEPGDDDVVPAAEGDQ